MRIDPNKLRENQEYPVTVDFQNTIAAELDRLYALEDATTPFKDRAEVETWLKGKGVRESRIYHIADLADYDRGIDYVCLEDGTIYITGMPPNKNQRTLFQGNIKLLTPAMLGKILEAK